MRKLNLSGSITTEGRVVGCIWSMFPAEVLGVGGIRMMGDAVFVQCSATRVFRRRGRWAQTSHSIDCWRFRLLCPE